MKSIGWMQEYRLCETLFFREDAVPPLWRMYAGLFAEGQKDRYTN
jgi:hypothetical protein